MIYAVRNTMIIILLIVSAAANAQDFSFKNYQWQDAPGKVTVPEKYQSEKEVILERVRKIEFVSEKGKASQFYLFHEKVFINSDDAVERNNKIYIPFSENEVVLTTKARVISPSGKVTELRKTDIKEEHDEERGMKYKYFAVNGLEKGAVIEKLFILEENPEIKGHTIKMQDNFPIVSNIFELVYPDHLIFKTKSYNGLAQPILLQNLPKEGLITMQLKESDVVALHDDERYGNWNSNVRRFRYKLDQNLANAAKNLNNFKEFSTNFYDRYHPEYSKKEIKLLEDFCAAIPRSKDTQEQIWNIENKIKTSITYSRYLDHQETLQEIIKSKQANQVDILRLYVAVFHVMGVENNIVITSDRSRLPFDKDFESYENLSDVLFYFPATGKFLTPLELEYRTPLIPSELAGTHGLFIREKIFGGIKMGIGEVSMIDIAGAETTHDIMDIVVDFRKDMANPLITDKLQFGGYSAINFQPIKDFAPADQYKTILKSIAENYAATTEFKTIEAENEGVANIGKKPFVLNLTFDGETLVNKAGDNFLFSVGQTIGKQMELYQEHKREMPVEINYPHSYTRTIRILLPDGIQVKNLDKLKMNYTAEVNGKTEAAFISNYQHKGNEITITNTEYYNVLHYPLSSFDAYRAVINAAADFNKIVVILSR